MTDSRLEEAYVPDIIPDEDVEHYERGGYGARMGWGDTPAVLVVDMVKIFTDSDFPLGRSDTAEDAIASTERLLAAARDAELPVYYTRMPLDEAVSSAYRGIFDKKKAGGSEQWDREAGHTIDPALEPADDDVVLEKSKPSAFFDTHLGNLLRQHSIDTLVVAGVSTSGSIRATVLDALCSNFNVIVPQECVSDRSVFSHEVTLFELDMKYADVTPLDDVIGNIEPF
jgi:nicotinamidase-related amidase